MKCPVDDSPLSISSREGIEIDFCPQCRGVWLDRGELDKIIERAASAIGTASPEPVGRAGGYERDRQRYDDRRYDDRRRYDDDKHYKRRKKRSFLDDLFDFD